MKRGSQPTDLQARTGLFTPPGMSRWASANKDCDVVVFMGSPSLGNLVEIVVDYYWFERINQWRPL
jgi:hypothetical protein